MSCFVLHWYLTRVTFFKKQLICLNSPFQGAQRLYNHAFFCCLKYCLQHNPCFTLSLEDPLSQKVNNGTFVHMVYITLLVVHADKLLQTHEGPLSMLLFFVIRLKRRTRRRDLCLFSRGLFLYCDIGELSFSARFQRTYSFYSTKNMRIYHCKISNRSK